MYKKLNYAIGDVASTTAIDATTLTLKAGHTITTDIGETNKFVAVFYDGTKSSPYQDTNREIVEAYRTNTNDFVIARAKEGTSAKQWIENDKFMLIASAGVFNEYETEIASKQDALGYIAENAANKKTSLTDNSDTYYPTQKAVKTAVDSKVNLDQTTPQTITDGSPLFSEGVDMANDKWLKSKDYAGTGYLNILKGNEDNEVDVGTQLNVGSIEAEEDSGAISLFDMAVSSASADGTEMSATIKIDGNNILKIYAESDGAGGADTFKVQLLNKAVLTMQDSAGTTHTYTADTDGSLIIS
jgi:hypothetical protein